MNIKEFKKTGFVFETIKCKHNFEPVNNANDKLLDLDINICGKIKNNINFVDYIKDDRFGQFFYIFNFLKTFILVNILSLHYIIDICILFKTYEVTDKTIIEENMKTNKLIISRIKTQKAMSIA